MADRPESNTKISTFSSLAGDLYQKVIIEHSKITLFFIFSIIILFASFIPRVQLDVSADSLILENDKDLIYYREIRKRYGSDDFLIVTITPHKSLFSEQSLQQLQQLKNQLKDLPRVKSVVSILNVPLIESPPQTLNQVSEKAINLFSEETDFESAKKELIESPLYSNRLTSKDGKTTALQVNFVENTEYQLVKNQIEQLQIESLLASEQRAKLNKLELQLDKISEQILSLQQQDIGEIREIIEPYKKNAIIHLGGIPMIVVDMKQFIRHDLAVFGSAVLGILSLFLLIIFRRFRWILLSLLTASSTAIVTLGIVGLQGWKITVVSSNFVALLLIFSLSLSIHLIVRYRELHNNNPEQSQSYLVTNTIKSKWGPCLFTVLTTLVAFASFVLSGIRPVIDFGWFMVTALSVALIFAFTIFPAALMLFKPGKPNRLWKFTATVTNFFARQVSHNPSIIWLTSIAVLILSFVGISKLSVENRFIDYFKSTTEIYQGMMLIDQQLGGTTPLDIIINPPSDFSEELVTNFEPDSDKNEGKLSEEDEMLAALDDDVESGFTTESYWYNSSKIEEINNIHRAVENSEFTGKVLSLDTTFQVLKILNDESQMDDFFLSLLYKKLPAETRQQLIDPYLSEDGNQLRLDVRIYDSDINLKRQNLLDDLRNNLINEANIKPEQIQFTGMTVLYNNMLQSLFRSQILTLGVVFLAILITFIVIFKSLKIAAIALVPNLLAAAPVLGLMGLLSIPLDIMTITIAAISIGIAVDNTIHYIHRFKIELMKDYNYKEAMHRSHHSIGRAMYYTSVTITLGFSVLAFSNFVPTIYFGLLTAFAMISALLADLAVLPWLLQKIKPYGVKA